MLTFLSMVLEFLDKVLAASILRDLSLYSLLFYCMILVSFWVVLTRR